MEKSSTVTIRDVAQRAGVSIATVSYVINESAPVSKATRARVLAAAAELGYHPSITTRGLRARESRTIGYSWHSVSADRWHPILDRFVYSMAEAAEAHGYHILTFVQSSEKDPWVVYEGLMLSGRVDGFVLSETNWDGQRIRHLLDAGFPFVAFGRTNEGWDFPYTDVDGEDGVHQDVEHVLSLGHHRIGIVAWPKTSLRGYHRYNGYVRALGSAGIPIDPAWIIRAEHTEAAGRQAVHTWLALPPDHCPTAVVAVSDLLAIGAMNGMYEAGLRPGQDMAVVGFNDISMARDFWPPLTTVRQPIIEVRKRVIDMLLQIIQGRKLAERKVSLEPELIVRESSGGSASSP